MFRYERISYEESEPSEFIYYTHQHLFHPKWRRADVDTVLQNDVYYAIRAASYIYCELSPPFGDLQPFLEKGVSSAIEYFWGDYRKNYVKFETYGTWDETACRIKLPWVEPFLKGILCSLWMNDGYAVKRISEYIDKDLVESQEPEGHASDQWWCILLAKYLCGNQLEKNKDMIDLIVGLKRKRAVLLTDILIAMESSPKELRTAFLRYMKHFLKEVDRVNKSRWAPPASSLYFGPISIPGSLLWSLAQFRGLELPRLPEEFMDRILIVT